MGAVLLLPLLILLANLTSPLQAAETVVVTIGVTEPVVDVILSTSVPGIVSAQRYQEGDAVKAGDVILELDKQLETMEVERRKLVLDLRKLDLDATQTLFEKTKSVPKEELDKKRVDYQVALVEHHMALEQLQRRMVTAPSAGIITDLLLDVGEATEAYDPLMRLVDPLRCRFKCDVEAKVAASLKLNQTVSLQIDTGAEPAKVSGTVAFISPVADPASGLISVKVLFANPEGRIRPGLAGKMIISQ